MRELGHPGFGALVDADCFAKRSVSIPRGLMQVLIFNFVFS